MVFLVQYDLERLTRAKSPSPIPGGPRRLEWQTPENPPGHGNFGPELPVVYRWAYDYSVPGVKDDFVPQNVAPEEVPNARRGRACPLRSLHQPAE